eukprot:6194799-Pleurochrysis_carterae.AAC.1
MPSKSFCMLKEAHTQCQQWQVALVIRAVFKCSESVSADSCNQSFESSFQRVSDNLYLTSHSSFDNSCTVTCLSCARPLPRQQADQVIVITHLRPAGYCSLHRSLFFGLACVISRDTCP